MIQTSLNVWITISQHEWLLIAPFVIVLVRARHGVQLERGPFDKRTADYLWMYIFGAFSLLVQWQ